LLPRAFIVEGETPPSDEPPVSGDDYLRRVRWEARRCPQVVVSKIDPRQYDNKQTQFANIPPPCPPAPPGMTPLPSWEDAFLSIFSELRQKLNYLSTQSKPKLSITLPRLTDAKGWTHLCFGYPSPSDSPSSSTKEPPSPPISTGQTVPSSNQKSNSKYPLPPLLSIILQLDHVSISSLLQYHIEWLETKILTRERALWIFALLTRLDKPLDADMAASLRKLLRRASVLRSQLKDAGGETLPSLNIIIVIVAKYFGQQEPES